MNMKIFSLYTEISNFCMLEMMQANPVTGPSLGSMINLVKAQRIIQDLTDENEVISKLERLLVAVRDDNFIFTDTEYKRVATTVSDDLEKDVFSMDDLASVDEKFANSPNYKMFKETRDRYRTGEDLAEIALDVLGDELGEIAALVEKVTGKKLDTSKFKTRDSDAKINDAEDLEGLI